MAPKKRKSLKPGEQLEDRIAPSIIAGIAGIDEIPEEIAMQEKLVRSEALPEEPEEILDVPDDLPQ